MNKYVPTLLLHIFYPESRKVGFGWALFLVATAGTFFVRASGAEAKAVLSANEWLLCVAMASGLIGGGTIADAKMELEKAKLDALGGKPNANPQDVPVAPAQ